MASSTIYPTQPNSYHHNNNIDDQLLEMSSITTNRKFSTNSLNNFNTLPLSYPNMFSQHDQPKLTPDLFQRQQNDFRTAQPAGNHFTLNQSITHVNLVNNRYPLNLPSHQGYNPINSYSAQQQENVNMNMPPSSNTNMYYKQEARSPYDDHIPFSAPSTNSITPVDNGMNYTPATPHANNDFHSLNFNKYSMPLNGINMPNDISRGTKNEFSPPAFNFNNHHLSNNNNNNNNNTIFPPFSSPMEKLTNIFVPGNFNKSRDQDVEQVEDTQKCKNTIEGTKTSVRRFKKWYKERYNKELDMNSVNRFNAPELLKDFFLDIRDTRPGRVGNEYEPVTLTTYRNGLRRYFLYRKTPPAPDTFDLTDKTFDLVNRHLVTKRDDLKRSGKGNHPNAIESITPEQLEKMWATGAIGTHAPRPLLRLMWWYNTVLHGVRGRMAHHELTTDDFLIQRALDGKLLMEYTKNKSEINMQQDDKLEPPKKKRFKGLAKETDGGDRDPIRAFEIFKAHRPQGISSFYLTPKHKPKGNVWFNKVPMGKNSIGRIMREIKAISNI